ncbi:MAG: winged helix-turn-helix domain-containing protein [Burkholderiales bacterium]
MAIARNRIQLRLRIDVDRKAALGPGKIALLEAITETGSISAAARKLGMSYRRAWLLIDDTNSRLRTPAVTRAKGGSRGGSSELTETGRRLIELYRKVEATAYSGSDADIRALAALLNG